MDKSSELPLPPRQEGIATKEKSFVGFAEVTRDSPIDVKEKVNAFLNKTVKGGLYEWSDKKFGFYLERGAGYHAFFFEKDGQVQAAYDYEVYSNGNSTVYRLKANLSPSYYKQHGETLGDAMIEDMSQNLSRNGVREMSAEVTEDGYKLLKRAQERGLIALVEDKPPAKGFGVVKLKPVDLQKAKRIANLRHLQSTLRERSPGLKPTSSGS